MAPPRDLALVRDLPLLFKFVFGRFELAATGYDLGINFDAFDFLVAQLRATAVGEYFLAGGRAIVFRVACGVASGKEGRAGVNVLPWIHRSTRGRV